MTPTPPARSRANSTRSAGRYSPVSDANQAARSVITSSERVNHTRPSQTNAGTARARARVGGAIRWAKAPPISSTAMKASPASPAACAVEGSARSSTSRLAR